MFTQDMFILLGVFPVCPVSLCVLLIFYIYFLLIFHSCWFFFLSCHSVMLVFWLALSLRYHNLNPNYIHDRLKLLGQTFTLRVLLVQVDVVSYFSLTLISPNYSLSIL